MAMKLPQLSNEQKKILGVGIVMMLALGWFYYKFFWRPWSQRIAEDRQKTLEVRIKIASAQQEAKHLEILEKEMEGLSSQTLDAEKRLPKTRDMPTVFDTMNRLAQRYKVQLGSFSAGTVNARTYFIEIAYQISITGRYHDIGRFLASIATEERIYNVRDVSYAGGGGDDPAKLNVNFTLLAYQYKG